MFVGCRKKAVVYAVAAALLLLAFVLVRWKKRDEGSQQSQLLTRPSLDDGLGDDKALAYGHGNTQDAGSKKKKRRRDKNHIHASARGSTDHPEWRNGIRRNVYAGKHRYVLGMNYWEQFNMALRNFFRLACMVEQWNASVIKPYTTHSRLYGLNNLLLDDYLNSSEVAYDLDLILRPDSLDSILREHGLHSMSDLDPMLRHGDRRLIFLHFVSSKPVKEYKISSPATKSFLANAFQKNSVVNCSSQPELIQLSRLVTSNLNSRLEKLTESRTKPFHPHQYYCINMNYTLTPESLATTVGIGKGNVSIVVINWRGTSSGGVVHSSARGSHASNRIAMKDGCFENKPHTPFTVQFSPSVLRAADGFMQTLGLVDQQFMVVHLRSEKLTIRQGRFPRLLQNCVIEGLQMRDDILDRERRGRGEGGVRVLYFSDIGPFGSETCRNCKAVEQVKRLFEKYRIEMTHFSPAQFDLPQDGGFVAAVEMTVMSRASHVILIGGGAFQGQVEVRYLERQLSQNERLKKEAVKICSTDQQAQEITQRFSPHRRASTSPQIT